MLLLYCMRDGMQVEAPLEAAGGQPWGILSAPKRHIGPATRSEPTLNAPTAYQYMPKHQM
jgi:hypothetical protein